MTTTTKLDNTRERITPDGEKIIMVHRKKGHYNMTLQRSTTMNESVSTEIVHKDKSKKPPTDTYTQVVLKEQYDVHKNYVEQRIESSKRLGIKVRLPSIPEDISENMIKFMIHKSGDTSSRWNTSGDLLSDKEGRQECKCFTSLGPSSFTPSSNWDVIYFLDATKWLNDEFILYRVPIKMNSQEWKNIKVSKTQTIDDQCKQGRRPRISWQNLVPQLNSQFSVVYRGCFLDIFT